MTDRREITDRLAGWLSAPGLGWRVAVDGPDAAGKTTLADELASTITELGRPAVRASLDGFHRPARERYRRGKLSPEGYYYDSFDLPRLRSYVLDPFGPGGNRTYRVSAFDVVADEPVQMPTAVASSEALLVVDGVFLLRPELAPTWDRVIFLEIDEVEILRRAESRDAARIGPSVRDRYVRRYLPAQRIYRKEARPLERADVVIDNNDPNHPVVLKAPWLLRPAKGGDA